MADLLVLGGVDELIQPDAVHDFGQSVESGVLCRVQSKRVAPLGPHGELVWGKLAVVGYYATAFSFTVTPIINGVRVTQLATVVSRPGPPSNLGEVRFSAIVGLYAINPDWPNIRTGLVGSTMDVVLEISDPTGKVDIEKALFLHEPIHQSRNKLVNE